MRSAIEVPLTRFTYKCTLLVVDSSGCRTKCARLLGSYVYMYRVALRQCSCEFINPQVSSTTVLGTLIWYDACGEMVWRWLKNRRHFLQVALWTHAQHSAHSKHNPKAAMHLSAFCLSVLIEVQMSMQFAQLTVIDWLGASYESRFIFFFSFFDIFGNCKKSFILHDTMWLWAIFAKLFCNFELFRNHDRHCW